MCHYFIIWSFCRTFRVLGLTLLPPTRAERELAVKFTEENESDFLTALALESERQQEKVNSPRVTSPSYLYYSQRIRYCQQVKRYRDRFKPEQIKIIVFEEFKSANERTYGEILEFLGVDSSFIPEYEAVNVNKEVKFQVINNLVNSPLVKNISKNLLSQEFNEFVRKTSSGSEKKCCHGPN